MTPTSKLGLLFILVSLQVVTPSAPNLTNIIGIAAFIIGLVLYFDE